MDKDIATLLREIKDVTKWSEPQIAVALGTSQPTVNRILHGQVDCRGSTFKAISELYERVCVAAGQAERRSTDPGPSLLK